MNNRNKKKELLLKDLCARLPYETRVRYIYAFAGAVGISGYSDEGILSYDKLQDFSQTNVGYEKRRVDNILPYLRPMSSMTEEEKDYYDSITYTEDETHFKGVWCNTVVDWLNTHYFDYRGLIEMGLAVEAPAGMYNFF